MIYFLTPYSFEKKLFEAWKQYMSLIADDDWACMMDGDALFFQSNFGHLIQDYINKYPDTGIFTCYASRSGFAWILPPKNMKASHNILIHHGIAMRLQKENHTKVHDINRKVTGQCMVMKKSTWSEILPELEKRCEDRKILNIDVQISQTVLDRGYKIRMMEGMYMLHYYRMAEGDKRKKQLT